MTPGRHKDRSTNKENTILDPTVETAPRNATIWHLNQNLGIGTATLAKRYGVSRQRIKQIIAREVQKRQLALSVLAPEDRFPS